MRLSRLQKYILFLGYEERGKLDRSRVLDFYKKSKLESKSQVNTITKSLERLIARGLLVGYGVRTSKKWFIKKVRLTPFGRKAVRFLHGEQKKLPLEKKK